MSLSAKIEEALPGGASLGSEAAYVLIDNATLWGDARDTVLAQAKEHLARHLDSTALFVTIDNAELDRVRDAHLMKMPHEMEPVTVLYGFNVMSAIPDKPGGP